MTNLPVASMTVTSSPTCEMPMKLESRKEQKEKVVVERRVKDTVIVGLMATMIPSST